MNTVLGGREQGDTFFSYRIWNMTQPDYSFDLEPLQHAGGVKHCAGLSTGRATLHGVDRLFRSQSLPTRWGVSSLKYFQPVEDTYVCRAMTTALGILWLYCPTPPRSGTVFGATTDKSSRQGLIQHRLGYSGVKNLEGQVRVTVGARSSLSGDDLDNPTTQIS